MTTDGRSYDILDGQFYVDDPYGAYRWMRTNDPVHWDRTNELWGVTRYDDIVEVEKHKELFINSGKEKGGYRPNIPADDSIIGLDDPMHLKRRSLVNRRFTPRAVTQWQHHIDATVTSLVDAALEKRSVEVVEELAAPLPAMMIGKLLGFPDDMWPKLKHWSETTIALGGGPRYFDEAGMLAAIEFGTESVKLLEEKKRCPADDIMTFWSTATIDGQPLSPEDIGSDCLLLLDGGAETTRTVIARTILNLAARPDQWQKLRDGADLTVATEEFIRFVTPIHNMCRTVTRDTELHGTQLRAGDQLVLLYASANRDEDHFDDPEALDVTRHPNNHLSFGFGTHFCLGAALARLEIRTFFRELVARVKEIRVDESSIVEMPNAFVFGLRSADIELIQLDVRTDLGADGNDEGDTMNGYDDIIVGGGSAGVALAVRLTEDPARRVLLLEAGSDVTGPSEPDVLSDQMRFSSQLTEWGIDASFVPGGSLNYPQGRKLGGGSAVNGAFAVRGLPDDYARWAAAGGDAWSWPHMLRVLRRLESDQDFPDRPEHGADGPIPVVRWRHDELLPMQRSFLGAVGDRGIPWVDDANAPDASGVGAIPMNRHDGLRMSTALTYLPPVRDRPNLHIRTGAEVTRLVLDGMRATGVEVVRGSDVERLSADRIVVSAGALQSPSLLMRSGIGPAAHLGAVGIRCVLDLPGVGENLMDHQGTAVFLLPKVELAPADDRVCQLGARWTSSLGLAADDMWLSMWSVWELAEFPDLQAAVGGLPAISAVIAGVHDPLSRGTVRLRSSDPTVRPQVDFNMLSHPDDMTRMVEALQLAIDLATSDAFADAYSGIGLLDPSMRDDRDVLEGYLRNTVGGWYHASGTCRMGSDPAAGAVVDGMLRVHGVEGLHVADASIMPTVVRAPTNLSSVAIGERAAELLR